jgi:hypothetical protein
VVRSKKSSVQSIPKHQKAARPDGFHSAILILATIIIDETFSPDKNQKVTPGFMQRIIV